MLVLAGIATVTAVLVVTVFMRLNCWKAISNGVEVTERQLPPQLFEIHCELGERLGMTPNGEGLDKLPRLYVVNGNGVMNAYATQCRHVSVWRSVLRPVSNLLQVGQRVSRAQEHTADRFGSFLTPGAALGMVSLMAGKHMGRDVHGRML